LWCSSPFGSCQLVCTFRIILLCFCVYWIYEILHQVFFCLFVVLCVVVLGKHPDRPRTVSLVWLHHFKFNKYFISYLSWWVCASKSLNLTFMLSANSINPWILLQMVLLHQLIKHLHIQVDNWQSLAFSSCNIWYLIFWFQTLNQTKWTSLAHLLIIPSIWCWRHLHPVPPVCSILAFIFPAISVYFTFYVR
jgi:hypothetical protein